MRLYLQDSLSPQVEEGRAEMPNCTMDRFTASKLRQPTTNLETQSSSRLARRNQQHHGPLQFLDQFRTPS